MFTGGPDRYAANIEALRSLTDMILHRYPNSPFSEKVRIAFGLKQAA